MVRAPRMAIGALVGALAFTAALTAYVVARPGSSPATPSRDQAPVPLQPQPLAVVETLPRLKAALDAGGFNGAVLVARGDDVLFRQVYGLANHEQGRPLALDSRFRLASVSKQFTAVALLKLEDQGALSLDDPVCRWIDPCPEAWAPIRLHHLISHTSGIPDLMARPDWGRRRVTPATGPELTADSAGYGLQFQPGTRVRYNNAAFNLAAEVTARASGMAFDDYLRTALFEPLGLADTGLGDAPGMVMGYARFPSGLAPQPLANVSIVEGAGALYSTLDDLLAWQRALYGGRVLSEAALARMTADHAPADTPSRPGRTRRDWGYGVFAGPLGEAVTPAFHDRQIYHTGSWAGFRNLTLYQPDSGVSVIVLSNHYDQRPRVILIAQQALAEALGRPFPEALAESPA